MSRGARFSGVYAVLGVCGFVLILVLNGRLFAGGSHALLTMAFAWLGLFIVLGIRSEGCR